MQGNSYKGSFIKIQETEMKKIVKVLWFYLQIEMVFLNRNEAIHHFCTSDPRFQRDDLRPYDSCYSVFQEGVFIGSLVLKHGEWAFIRNALTGDIEGVKSLAGLKKVLKKYAKI